MMEPDVAIREPRLRVYRSPARQFLMGLAGLVLIVAAIEILWIHEFSLSPERDDNGNLTRRGESRLRQDIVAGSVFVLTGGGLLVIALAGLLNPSPVLELDDEGITLRIAGPRTSVRMGWQDIITVRSGREPNDAERSRPVLLVALAEPELWPAEYWGARRDGSWIVADAASWNIPPEEIVVHTSMVTAAFARARAASAGPPPDEDAEGSG